MKKTFFLLFLACLLCGCTTARMSEETEEMVPKNTHETERTVVQGTNYDNTKICWGFRKIKEKAPDIPSNWQDLLARFDGFYVGDQTQKKLYLTFDEGYENGYTAQILDVLKRTQTPAAFFVTGPYLKKEQALVKRMVEEGHVVGNHTINHPSMPDVRSDEALLEELNQLGSMFQTLTGQQMSYLRPPKGEFSERTLALSKQAGYKTIFWSSAYADWDVKKQKGTQYAVEQVTNQFHNGSIILLHAVSQDNANAMEEIIRIAREKGYTFCSLNEL